MFTLMPWIDCIFNWNICYSMFHIDLDDNAKVNLLTLYTVTQNLLSSHRIGTHFRLHAFHEYTFLVRNLVTRYSSSNNDSGGSRGDFGINSPPTEERYNKHKRCPQSSSLHHLVYLFTHWDCVT